MTPRAPSVSALSPPARLAAAALRGVSCASFPVLLVALLRATDPPITPVVLAEALFALALLPELCARLVLRAHAAELRVEDGALHVAGALRRVDLARGALSRAEAWRLPLPSAGLALRLASGARAGIGLAAPDPSALHALLAQAGAAPPAHTDPAAAWASARAACPRRWWDRALVKVGLASLLPGAVGFSAHQHIAFGGLFGEYYLMGPAAWLESAARYWAAGALYLVVWAGCFRAAVETLTWLAARAAPARAAGMRSAAERSAALLYYLSIPALLALRFLA
jgi:apolipoprotein N-acyltransferase